MIFVTVAIILVGSALFRFRTVGYARMKSQLASTTQDVAVITTSASSSGGNSHHLLSELLSYTNHGELLRFFNEQLLHLNPALARRTGIKIGSPSLARDEATGRAVLGVRVETPVTISSNGRNMFPMASSNFLMLCDLKFPIGSVKCQDSGIFPWAIPPQCSGARWFNPATSTFWGFLTVGPEDARLFFDSNGALNAVFGARGCHPNTPYNESNPIYSLYEITWDYDGGVWTPNGAGVPSLLDLSTSEGMPLDNYPTVTKSWIPLPPSNQTAPTHYLLGFTSNMGSSVVYEVFDSDDSMSHVRPAEYSKDMKEADTDSFRGSTNLVPFRGFLLGVGHPAARGGKYFLYW
jgi:hypothetical protein